MQFVLKKKTHKCHFCSLSNFLENEKHDIVIDVKNHYLKQHRNPILLFWPHLL